MGGEKRIYAKVDVGGGFTEVEPADIYRPMVPDAKQGLQPLDLGSLDGDLEKTRITEIPQTPAERPDNVRSTNNVMGFLPEDGARLMAERDAALRKFAVGKQEVPAPSGSADQTVVSQ